MKDLKRPPHTHTHDFKVNYQSVNLEILKNFLSALLIFK